MVKDIKITVLAFRNIGIEFEVVDTYRDLTELDDLVVAIGKVAGHRATSFTKDTVGCTTNGTIPCRPRVAKGLSDFSACRAVVEIKAQLSESIATNKGNHRNK